MVALRGFRSGVQQRLIKKNLENMMPRKKTTIRLAIAVAFGGLLSMSNAQGTVLAPFTGYSELGTPCDLCDSFVNFSVYQNDDGNWRDDSYFANAQNAVVLDGDLTGAEGYVYLYQVTNPTASSVDNPLAQFTVQTIPPNSFTGGGYFNGTVFQDAGGLLNGNIAGNYSLANPDPAPGTPDTPGDGANLRSGGPPSALTATPTLAIGGGQNASSLNLNQNWSNLAFDAGTISQGALFQFDTAVAVDNTSSLLFLVSDLPPRYLIGETESTGGSGSLGDIPTTVPEPGAALLVLAMGLTLSLSKLRVRSR